MTPAELIPAVVAASLAMQEMDRLKALECLPEPALLLARLEARRSDFVCLVGVCAAYLRAREVSHG